MSSNAIDAGDGDSSPSSDGINNESSFVNKVKTRVSHFITPSLSKWFGAKSVRHREEDDEGTCDVQPPPKRVRTSFPLRDDDLTSYAQSSNPFSMPDPFLDPIAGPSTSKQSRKLMLANASNHINQTHAKSSDFRPDQGSAFADRTSEPTIRNQTNNSHNRSVFNTSMPLERSLFGDRAVTPSKHNASLSSRRPSFNASVFASPNFVDNTLSTRRIINSPFYSGRLTYGGASASSRTAIPTNKPIETTPKKMGFDSNTSTLSKTAKRILDTLEQYSSPVQDARRIPFPRRQSLIGKYVGANPYMMHETGSVPATKELQVPRMSELLKMKLKERLQDSTTTVRELASTSSEARMSSSEYTLPPNVDENDSGATKKTTNKMKTKIASVRQRHHAEDEAVPEVNLPNVQLPISTLPSFNIVIPPSKASPSSSEPVKAGKLVEFTSFTIKPANSMRKIDEVVKPSVNFIVSSEELPIKSISETAEFKFAKPLVIAQNVKTIKAINNFKFSKPLVKKAFNNGANVTSKNVGSMSNQMPSWGDRFKPPVDSWECSVCLVRNNASKTKCLSCESPKSSNQSAPAAKSDDWECPRCKISNAETVKQCLNCESLRKSTAEAPKSTWGEKFKAPSNTWECSRCLVRNNIAKDCCEACENARPADVAAPPKDLSSFRKKEDEWECSSCMVRNANNKTRCVCCDSSKPSASSNAQTTEVPKFSFGMENGLINGHGFLFGIPTNSSNTSNTKKGDDNSAIIFGSNSKANAETMPATQPQFAFGSKPAAMIEKTSLGTKDATNLLANERKSPQVEKQTEPPAKKLSFVVPPTLSFGFPLKNDATAEKTPVKPTIFDGKSQMAKEPSNQDHGIKSGGINFAATSAPTINISANLTKPTMNGPAPSFTFLNPNPTNNKILAMDKVEKSTFGANVTSTGLTSVAFGSNVSSSTPFAFGGSSANTFGAGSLAFKKDENQQLAFGAPNTTTSLFGATAPSSLFSKPLENGVFTFGSESGHNNENKDISKAAYPFGMTVLPPAQGSFKFGANTLPAPQNGNAGYNFGSNANNNVAVFDASAKPSYNFTAGSAPTTFMAQTSGTNPQPSGRNFRKAIRRIR